jgi:glycosyltransferase involved in cell wall biosynthesis
LLFSIVVPTLGAEAKLLPLLDGIERQQLPREQFELIVVFDGAAPTPAVAQRLQALGARVERLPAHAGPPVARNRGAAVAHGTFLVSTDDDVVPDPGWLAAAAARIVAEPGADVIEGVTRKPGNRPVRIRGDETRQYILCNLIVRRRLFEAIGGFEEAFFDPTNGVYFREDADLGWRLELAGAHVVRDPAMVVTHPVELPGLLDPLRWTRRYEMDALLAARHPRWFRDRIEVHHLGAWRVRRPIVRAAIVYVIGVVLAALLLALGRPRAAAGAGLVAVAAFLVVWAKWRFDPARLPVYPAVPFGLAWALLRGGWRLRALPPATRVPRGPLPSS